MTITKKMLLTLLETYEVKNASGKVDYYKSPVHIGYHEASEIHEVLSEVLGNYGNETDEVSDADELQDDINEEADICTPIYSNDIAKWFSENWQAYNDTADKLGKDGMGDDIMKGIQISYCITLENEAMEALTALFEELENKEEEI